MNLLHNKTVNENLKIICDKLQAQDWDHKNSLYDIVVDREDLLLVDIYYKTEKMKNKAYGIMLLVPDKSYDDNHHFTHFSVSSEGVSYFADTLTHEEFKTKMNLSPYIAMEYLDYHVAALKKIEELESIRVRLMFDNDCVDLCLGNGHLH